MARISLTQRRYLSPLLLILAAACGCQSHNTVGVAAAAWLHASSPGSQAASTVSAPTSETSAGGSRRVVLAAYRDGSADDGQTAGPGRRGTGNDSVAGGGTNLSMSLAAMQDAKTDNGDKAGGSKKSGNTEEDLAEINNKLNNPGADLAQLNFKMNWNQFQGSLGGTPSLGKTLRRLTKGNPIRNLLNLGRASGGEGASSQNSLTLDFQPVFPFKLSGGGHLLIRPTIPITWKPYHNQRSNSFDNQFGLGDAQIVAFYSRTDKKKGIMWGAGLTTQFPTHTDDVLGNDAFMMGPAGFVGRFGKWGSVGVFPQHWWNIGGGDGYTSLTAVQPWYWFNVGKGYQIGGSPIITYNWALDDSDNNLTVPVNLGVAKTILIGKLPVKIRFEGIYYAVTPDEFGPQWGMNLTFTPVIANPFEKHASKKAG